MSILKTKLRKDIIEEFGNKLDDMLESAQRGCFSHEGGAQSLKEAAKQISRLAEHVDEDIDDGVIGKLMAEGELKLAEYIKKWILRAAHTAEGMSLKMETQKLVFEGRADAMRAAVKYAKDEYDKSEKKIRAYDEAIAEGLAPDEAERPQLDARADLEARRAEAKARKESAKKEPEAAEEPADEPAEKSASEPKKMSKTATSPKKKKPPSK